MRDLLPTGAVQVVDIFVASHRTVRQPFQIPHNNAPHCCFIAHFKARPVAGLFVGDEGFEPPTFAV